MTRDELVAKIEKEIADVDELFRGHLGFGIADVEDSTKVHRALLAVVGLHKPIREPWALECEHCQGIADGLTQNYPCETIQAIEKALG